jgi:hypothetical protein
MRAAHRSLGYAFLAIVTFLSVRFGSRRLAFHGVDFPDYNEYGQGHDNKVDYRVYEEAVVDGSSTYSLGCSQGCITLPIQRDKQLHLGPFYR